MATPQNIPSNNEDDDADDYVVISGVDIPFRDMVWLCIQFLAASVIASIPIGIAVLIFWFILIAAVCSI